MDQLHYLVLQRRKREREFLGENRTDRLRLSNKAKSDFVSKLITENALQGIWDRLMQTNEFAVVLVMEPFGEG